MDTYALIVALTNPTNLKGTMMAQPMKPMKPMHPSMMDKLKAYVSPGSTAGTLRDRKKKVDQEIEDQVSGGKKKPYR